MNLDGQALRAGGSVALVFAVPFSIGARLAADADHPGWAIALTMGAIVGFVLGAGCAAWIQRLGTPWTHGIVTAVATYLLAQAVFVVIKLIRGGDVSWFAIFFNLSFVALAGLIGGMLGQSLARRGFQPTGLSRGPDPR